MNLYWCSFCLGFNFQTTLKFQTLPSSWKTRSRMLSNDNFLQKSFFPPNTIFSSCILILLRWKYARTAQTHDYPLDNQNTCSPETATLTKHWACVIKKNCIKFIRNPYLFLERSSWDSNIEEKRKRRGNMAQGRDGGKKPAHGQRTVLQLRKTLVRSCRELPDNIPARPTAGEFSQDGTKMVTVSKHSFRSSAMGYFILTIILIFITITTLPDPRLIH